MKKFEAAKRFLELVLSHPEDFTATVDSERSDKIYTIKNNYRDASINIKESSTHALSTTWPNSERNSIMFATDEDLKKLHEWACNFIAEKQIQDKVDKDNDCVWELLKYYEEKRLRNVL